MSVRGPAPEEIAPPPLEEAIQRRARDFELPALLALLRARFPRRTIRFRSRPSRALEPTLVDAVDFEPEEVWITVNVGLASSTSPLPSYFIEMLAHPRAGPALEGLLGLADDQLLRDRGDGAAPAASERMVEGAQAMRKNALDLARPASPLGLSWVLEKVFPELRVFVRRAAVERRMPALDARIGQVTLGVSALGGEAEVKTPGLDVILVTDESTTWSGEPWPREARRRLVEHVYPVLGSAAAHLRVLFVDREAAGKLHVYGPGELGFDPLGRGKIPEIMTLFEGRVPSADGASPASNLALPARP
jgi:hypothetical protein